MTYDVRRASPSDSVGKYILALHEHNKLQTQHPFESDEISIFKRKLASNDLDFCLGDAEPFLSEQIKTDIYNMMYELYPSAYTPRWDNYTAYDSFYNQPRKV